jgi:hypothetical protein
MSHSSEGIRGWRLQGVPQAPDRRLCPGGRCGYHHGCGDACPIYLGTRHEDWDLQDPAGQPVEVVRRIRDDLDGRVQHLLAGLVPTSA